MHPRNKNMVIGSLIEALLYDMQRSHLPRFNQLKNLEEIADHCTMCRKCFKPCPVDIDTADVSVLERNILSDLGYKHTAPATRLSLMYLQSRNKTFNAVFRKGVVEVGSAIQRYAATLFAKAPANIKENPWRPLNMLKTQMMPASKETLSASLPPFSENEALMITPKEGEFKKTVFYFPGCGSERLYSEIGKASIYILLKNQIRVILPPASLCCGFPQKINAKKKMSANISLRDTIILTQIRDMLGHIGFDGFLISCGTCREALHEIGCEEIFGCQIVDVSRFAIDHATDRTMEKQQKVAMYHAPCHDSFDGDGVAILGQFFDQVKNVPSCCSEAGTLAISRPDISNAMYQRKRESISSQLPTQTETIIATNCPSCISGLGRNRDLGIVPKHMAVLLAETIGGEQWEQEFSLLAARAEKVTY
jgi:Fe-S oxidoreductase